MSKSPNAKPPKKPKPEDIETDSGAWDRFEHAVDAAVKSGPKHRTTSNPRKKVIGHESSDRDSLRRVKKKGDVRTNPERRPDKSR